jgi:two-component system, chemotaxis family, CheB/CheR fusion protein
MEPLDELKPETQETTKPQGKQQKTDAPPITGDPGFITDNDISPPRGLPFPVVGVGASAGGLEAFTQLLRALPANTGMAYVLVQHLDPHHESQLKELLAPATEMPVLIIESGMTVKPDTVYVMPPNVDLALEDCKLLLSPRKPGLHLPIDSFFETLAIAQGGRAIAIVLSGNASDGSRGIKAIKGECGITFAQDESSARHSGMPRSAAATGAVDFILPPAEIARELIRLSQHPYVVPPAAPNQQKELLPEDERELKRIFALLKSTTHVDFSHYKQNTIRRRIGRRMIVQRTPNVEAYARYLEKHPAECRELYRDLLISVTNFFRDPESFETLSAVLSNTLASRKSQEPFRVWVPGCATGEEVYSLAIALQEVLEQLQISASVQLFGTDISDVALERARSGTYTENVVQEVSTERLRRFFFRVDGGYRINKAIRETCVFARQDLTRDPPFGHTDLISCRNVLIYMDSYLQKKVLPVFHYSLNPDGLLLLGSAETVGTMLDLFIPVDKQHRIYRRKAGPSRFTFEFPTAKGAPEPEEPAKGRAALTSTDLQKKVDRIIQSKYAPAAVLVDSELQILQFRGHTSFYLDPKPGEASLNLLRMAREGLVLPLRRVIEAATAQGISIREKDIHLQHQEEYRDINLEVTPIMGPAGSERYYLVVFENIPVRDEGDYGLPAVGPEDHSQYAAALEGQVRSLQQQLAETREYLRNLNEDHEASTEELRAANEEVRSSNEELQSTNEELSTTKEELQSANEELTTVNEELQHRNQELDAVNSDLSNLLSAVNIPILMVDSGLRLRRFNTATETLLELAPSDLGRPVAHLRGRIVIPDLEQMVRGVLDTLVTAQREVMDDAGTWYSLSIRPYRTLDNRIDGAVLSFVDIDPLKRSLRTAEDARDYADAMIETVREPLVVLDSDLRIQRATATFYEVFQVSREETIGRFLYDLGNGQWNRPRLRELLGDALFRDSRFQDFEVEHDFPYLGHRVMRLNGQRIFRHSDQPRAVLLAIEDVTKRLEEAEVRYRRLFESAKDGMLVLDAETETITDVNPYMLALTGYPREEFVGKKLFDAAPFAAAGTSITLTAEALKSEVVRHDMGLIGRNGKQIPVEMVANRYSIGSRQVIQANIRDITGRKRAIDALKESEERFRLFVEGVQDYALFQMDVDGNVTAWSSGAERILGYSEQEVLGKPADVVFTPEDRAHGEAGIELETARKTGRAEDERWHQRKDGSRFFASGVISALRDDAGNLRGFAKIMRDSTERKKAEEQIRISLRDKEVLLKEIHHRIKNNLQVIASLLGLQAGYLRETDDSKALAIIEEMQNRVRSIAVIHQMLYGSPDLARIEFGAYAQKMAKDLFVFYSIDRDRIGLRTDLGTEFLTISQAVPCGLILNELITNCLKHAFPEKQKGVVHVSFSCSDDECILEVADDGAGLREGIEPQKSTSMGLQLVRLIVEQLEGTLSVMTNGGTHFTISFPKKAEGSAN